MTIRFLISVVIALALAGPDAAAQIPCSYEVAAIIQGPPCKFGEPSPAGGHGISPNGRYVCGVHGQCDLYSEAFVYDMETKQMLTIPRPQGVYSAWANDVNDSGTVVGGCWREGAGQRGWIYEVSTGSWTELQPQNPPLGWSEVTAVNASGTVCGWRTLDDGGNPTAPYNAFVWAAKEGITDLGVMNGPNSAALGLSQSVVVGWTGSDSNGLDTRGFIHSGGTTEVLTPVPDGFTSIAMAANDDGEVVVRGRVQQSPTIIASFLYSKTRIVELLPPDGFNRAFGEAVSNASIVVGSCSHSSDPFNFRGCIWINGVAWLFDDLIENRPEIALGHAVDLTYDSHVLASGQFGSNPVAYLLSPTRLPGDSNCDQVVNVDDLLDVIHQWGKCENCSADFDQSASVDHFDLMIVIDNWT